MALDVISLLESKLGREKPQALFTDIDGVLTTTRDSYALDLEVITLLRALEGAGVPVCLVSGNAYPVVLTLQRYLGLSPHFVAESGCVVQVGGSVNVLCTVDLASIVHDIKKLFQLEELPTNRFRLCDRAFTLPGAFKKDTERVKSLARTIMDKYPGIRVVYSGYALHVVPEECSKSTGVNFLARSLNIDLKKAIAIGDSAMDLDMVRAVGVGVAVGDADEELKKEALAVLPYGASESTKYLLVGVLRYLAKTL